jgi:hypothetical protein
MLSPTVSFLYFDIFMTFLYYNGYIAKKGEENA